MTAEAMTSVKVSNKNLENLKLQYEDMSLNQILETIALEESFMRRQPLPEKTVGDAAQFIGSMNMRFPGICIRDIITKTIKCMESESQKA